jgi:hypothetical protein
VRADVAVGVGVIVGIVVGIVVRVVVGVVVGVTVRHMYAATAVSYKGQFQGAVLRVSCQGLRPRQTDSLCI